MGIFGRSFNQKVQDAVAAVGRMDLGIHDLRATTEGKIVTLEGLADDLDIKGRVMAEFNKLVKTENTLNKIQVKGAPAGPPVPPLTEQEAAEETIHVVQPGDTLGALAQRYYGKASLYMKIFEANLDILNDPNLIKVGQKLKIPK